MKEESNKILPLQKRIKIRTILNIPQKEKEVKIKTIRNGTNFYRRKKQIK